MSLLVMSLLAHQRKVRRSRKRARRTRGPFCEIQPRPDPMDESDSEENSGLASNRVFPNRMTDGVKEYVNAREREDEINSLRAAKRVLKKSVSAREREDESGSEDESWSDDELYTVRMKEEWELHKRAKEDPDAKKVLDKMTLAEWEEAIRVEAVEFLNKALGISDGWKLFCNGYEGEDYFTCHLSEAELKVVQGHKDVRKVELENENSLWEDGL